MPTTHVFLLLDESWSMAKRAADVRSSFNAYVEELRADERATAGKMYRLTVIKFGSTVRPLWVNKSLDQVPLLTEQNYVPLDSTALYDAIGYALDAARQSCGSENMPYGVDPVILVITTDGLENASKNWSRTAIADQLARRKAAGNWTIVYMGADQDAWEQAQPLGLDQGNVLSYDSAQSTTAYHRLARATTNHRSATTKNFFE